MHELIVPLALSCSRVEANQRFAEEIRARSRATIEIVARRAHGQIEQSAGVIERHRSPDVRVAGVGLAAGAPCFHTEFAGARHGVKGPHEFAGAGVERADVSGRVLFINQAVGDAVAHDHEVLIDHRRAGVGVVLGVGLPAESVDKVDHAVIAEGVHWCAGFGIEFDEAVAAVHQDA
jgi:hypothetical protein